MRDAAVVIGEMLDTIGAARECCADKTFEGFSQTRMARLAAERALEILSEAARHLPLDVQDRHPHIPWAKIKAVGNVLRHEYHRVAPKIVWDVITADLDTLEAALRKEQAP